MDVGCKRYKAKPSRDNQPVNKCYTVPASAPTPGCTRAELLKQMRTSSLKKNMYIYCVHVCVWERARVQALHGTHKEVKGQNDGVSPGPPKLTDKNQLTAQHSA